MARQPRIKYTEELKAEIWHKYKQGESLWSIARSLNRSSSSIYRQLAPTGGIAPAIRTRSSRSLSLAEREEISRGLVASQSIRAMAARLGRAPSTISREIRRNGGRARYRATRADQCAWDRACRPKLCKLACNRALGHLVESKLRLHWSPEQIAGWLKIIYPRNENHQVSHETIYRSLFVQARGALKKELQQYLRSRRTIRRAKQSSLKGHGLGGMPNAISISQRPASVEDRAVPGHWEGDLIIGSHGSCMATDIQVYFCDPRSPWQRGSNENTNRLLRQYFPKRTDLSVHSQEELDRVARELNERPRKTLDFETPADRFNACVATIH